MSTTPNTNIADQTAKADQAAPAYYEILVELKEVSENDYEVVPHIPLRLEFGKTVQYKSDDGNGNYAGKVEIEFPNHSPYLKHNGSEITEVTSNEPPLELKVRGIFFGRCYITHNGVRYGWGPLYPGAGGNHDVQ
jgi:hypothetical protein